MKIGRNDPCWCGSGRKYKNCHSGFDKRIHDLRMEGHEVPTREMIKTPEDIEALREAGKMNTMVLDYAEQFVREGISTEELNVIIDEYTRKLGGIPAPLNYEGLSEECLYLDQRCGLPRNS